MQSPYSRAVMVTVMQPSVPVEVFEAGGAFDGGGSASEVVDVFVLVVA